jgi:hypothetical protein
MASQTSLAGYASELRLGRLASEGWHAIARRAKADDNDEATETTEEEA